MAQPLQAGGAIATDTQSDLLALKPVNCRVARQSVRQEIDHAPSNTLQRTIGQLTLTALLSWGAAAARRPIALCPGRLNRARNFRRDRQIRHASLRR